LNSEQLPKKCVFCSAAELHLKQQLKQQKAAMCYLGCNTKNTFRRSSMLTKQLEALTVILFC
jgi:hypothetical protein